MCSKIRCNEYRRKFFETKQGLGPRRGDIVHNLMHRTTGRQKRKQFPLCSQSEMNQYRGVFCIVSDSTVVVMQRSSHKLALPANPTSCVTVSWVTISMRRCKRQQKQRPCRSLKAWEIGTRVVKSTSLCNKRRCSGRQAALKPPIH